MQSRTRWLKTEKRRNAARVVAWTTTPGDNVVCQSWSQQPSHTKIGETLNNHLNQELADSQCPNLLQHDKDHLQRLTEYDEKDHRKSGNYPIQKCHRCTRHKIYKYFLSSVYKSLFVSLSRQTRADVTVSLRMTGTRASRVLDSRSKQIPLILKASRKPLQRFFHRHTPRHVLEIHGIVLALVQKFSLENAEIPHLQEPSNME